MRQHGCQANRAVVTRAADALHECAVSKTGRKGVRVHMALSKGAEVLPGILMM
jgi:hypothetical protein